MLDNCRSVNADEHNFILSATGTAANGDAPHKLLLRNYNGDAERAFAAILPVGSKTPDGVNPGVIYHLLRRDEAPDKRKKEADWLFAQADSLATDLSRWSMDLLRDLEARVPRMNDAELRGRRKRQEALRMAMDLPRALFGMKSILNTMQKQYSIDGLRSARFHLMRLDRDWTAFRRRMQDTRPDPLDAWCARVREMQNLAEQVRRGATV
ncbi:MULTISPECIES: hypothetical protein [Acidithiobacillus]|uniref:Uncharacterized protein n=2 Tax=Acidithiobacillus TaxID=119977 RepID=A0A179BNI4_ACIFR|nr:MULTISPECIES: hypothetical protein [Acidithiobacillus]MEB8474711.1 hypothetical protein [Acidithiobacillus ferriphilus]MEB8488153.1 hypothetical protein [Acidithiobacillus ferriphilus]MEB8488739.1 hypothetical protein [Acidithiobacillus ferriphilus]MEB8492183.1 hypothetical protein [Acidithiobacillus ferriphilus]MEB8513487.1 hypothetical protein [Acidithiobacillus ferriphilus]